MFRQRFKDNSQSNYIKIMKLSTGITDVQLRISNLLKQMLNQIKLQNVSLITLKNFKKGSGYFAVDGNLPSETILP